MEEKTTKTIEFRIGEQYKISNGGTPDGKNAWTIRIVKVEPYIEFYASGSGIIEPDKVRRLEAYIFAQWIHGELKKGKAQKVKE